MATSTHFPDVHYIWEGGISYVYEVNPHIVVKVPQEGECEEEQFQNEVKIYDKLSKHQPCSYLIDCFHYCENGIFLEYMKDASLSIRIQNNHTKDLEAEDPHRSVVLEVNKYEPLCLRLRWMNDLAQAAAFFESIGLVHGDIRPENVLIDGDNIKLADFDIAGEIGTPFPVCTAPYGRNLNEDESDQGTPGTPGFLGARTEQFALGGVFYFINYGFQMYGDRVLGEVHDKVGQKLEELLRTKQFPALNRDMAIDTVIYMCWNNKYATMAQLAAHTESLLATYSNRETRADQPATGEIALEETAAYSTVGEKADQPELVDETMDDHNATKIIPADITMSKASTVDAETTRFHADKYEHGKGGEESKMEGATTSLPEEEGTTQGKIPLEGKTGTSANEEGAFSTAKFTEGAMDHQIKTVREGTIDEGQNKEGAIGFAAPGEGATGPRSAEEGANQDMNDNEEGDSGIDLAGDDPAIASQSKKALCEDLENRGLLKLLCSGPPDEIGFPLEWYRYSKTA